MKQTEPVSHPADRDQAGGATIHPLRPLWKAMRRSVPEDPIPLEEAGEIVAQAMKTLLRQQRREQARSKNSTRSLATNFELSQMIDTFLAIRNPDRRRTCLAALRSCAKADAEENGTAG